MKEKGMNPNGVIYIQAEGNRYTFIYYVGDNTELMKEITVTSQKEIDNITFTDLLPVVSNSKK